jgi:hypothetical protein
LIQLSILKSHPFTFVKKKSPFEPKLTHDINVFPNIIFLFIFVSILITIFFQDKSQNPTKYEADTVQYKINVMLKWDQTHLSNNHFVGLVWLFVLV